MFIYLIYIGRLVCVCISNGRPNGLHDLDQIFGIDSHLPYG